MKHSLGKRLLRGIVLSLSVVVFIIALSVSQGGQAQEGNPNVVPPEGADALEARTDNPLGATGGPVAEGETITNVEAQALAALNGEPAQPLMEEPLDASIAMAAFSSPLVIPGAEFNSDGYAPEGFFFWFNGGTLSGKDVPGTCLMAPAYLPAGVTVTEMFGSVIDNDSAADDGSDMNVSISLRRVDNFNGTTQVMATVNSAAGASTDIQTPGTASIAYPDISYPNYSYFVTTCLQDGQLSIYSVRIYYSE